MSSPGEPQKAPYKPLSSDLGRLQDTDTLTYAEWVKSRGYDPKTHTYREDDSCPI